MRERVIVVVLSVCMFAVCHSDFGDYRQLTFGLGMNLLGLNFWADF